MAFIVERDSRDEAGRPRSPAATITLTQRMYRTAELLHVLTWAVAVVLVLELFTILGSAAQLPGAGGLALLALLRSLVVWGGVILVLRAVAFLLTSAAEQRPAEPDAVAGGGAFGTHCSNCDAAVQPTASRCPVCGVEFDAPADAQPAV